MHRIRSHHGGVRRRAVIAARGVTALILLAPAIALSGATRAGAAAGCTTSWKAPGTSGMLDVASNWTNGLPGVTSNVCIPTSATPYTVTEQGIANAHRLVVGVGATLRLESNVAPNVTLAVGSGGVTNSGTIELLGKAQPHPTVIAVSGATIENSGTLRVLPSGVVSQSIQALLHNTSTGTLDAESNTNVSELDNDGFVTVAAGTNLTAFWLHNYDADTHTMSRGVFNISGALMVPVIDVTVLDAEVAILGTGTLLNTSTGGSGLAQLSTITVNGSFLLDDGASLALPALTNQGRVSIGEASLLVTAGDYTQAGVYTSLSPGSRLLASHSTVRVTGGSIVGGGALLSPVVQTGGTLYPAPQITISGDYTQTAGGTLSNRVGGAAASTLVVNGAATLAGTLAVNADSGLSPQLGMTFPVVQAATLNGSFIKIVTGSLTAPFDFQASTVGSVVNATIVARYNDSQPYIAYQGWRAQAIATAVGGAARFTCTGNDTATLAFKGTSITWKTMHSSDSGKAQVLIDGVSKGTFDLYSATTKTFLQGFVGLTSGTHTITVRATGTKNTLASNTCVVVDGFTAGATFTDDTARTIGWSGWSGVAAGTDGFRSASGSGKTALLSAKTISGYDWITRTGPNQGMAKVTVDNLVVKTVNLYSPTVSTGVHVAFATTAGFHLVTITVLGTKDPASTGIAVAIDSIVAY